MSVKFLRLDQVAEYFTPRNTAYGNDMLAWFRGLGIEKLEELARLEYSIGRMGDRSASPEIVMDWIEEHGGERVWYYSYYLSPNKIKQYRQQLARIGR